MLLQVSLRPKVFEGDSFAAQTWCRSSSRRPPNSSLPSSVTVRAPECILAFASNVRKRVGYTNGLYGHRLVRQSGLAVGGSPFITLAVHRSGGSSERSLPPDENNVAFVGWRRPKRTPAASPPKLAVKAPTPPPPQPVVKVQPTASVSVIPPVVFEGAQRAVRGMQAHPLITGLGLVLILVAVVASVLRRRQGGSVKRLVQRGQIPLNRQLHQLEFKPPPFIENLLSFMYYKEVVKPLSEEKLRQAREERRRKLQNYKKPYFITEGEAPKVGRGPGEFDPETMVLEVLPRGHWMYNGDATDNETVRRRLMQREGPPESVRQEVEAHQRAARSTSRSQPEETHVKPGEVTPEDNPFLRGFRVENVDMGSGQWPEAESANKAAKQRDFLQ